VGSASSARRCVVKIRNLWFNLERLDFGEQGT
jgi:hypothetical protein